MKHHLEPESNLKSHQKTCDSATLLRAGHKSRLRDRISANHCNTEGSQNIYPASSVSQQAQWMSGKTSEDELVRYMSNMPSYLERGKKPQENVLSVGVLDWGRLEKWQSVHKLEPHRYSSYSPSSSNTSSSYSADGSTSDSSRGQSCSPAHQKTRRSLQFHLMASPLKDHSSAVQASGESGTKSEDNKFSKSSDLNQHDNFSRMRMPLPRSHTDAKLKQDREKELYAISSIGYDGSSDQRHYKEASNVKGLMVMCQVKKTEEKTKQLNLCAAKPNAPGRPKEPISVPRELPETKNPGACHLTDSRPILGLRSEEASQKTFPEKVKIIRPAEIISDVSQSCTVPKEVVMGTKFRVNQQSVVDTERIHCSMDAHKLVSQAGKEGFSPSAVRNSEKKNLSMTPARQLSKEFNQKIGKAFLEKPRSTSPFRRLSMSITKVGKTMTTKEDGSMPPSISKPQTTTYNSENGMHPACSGNLSCDRPSSAARSRSSPLRRLLDPLLKPKGSLCHQSSVQLHKGSTSTNGAYKSSNADVDQSSIQFMKARLDMSSCKTAAVNDSSKDKKNRSPEVQALVRVAFKNGLPLMTFAVGNNRNVLIATVKKSGSSDTDQCSLVYTIFDVQDVKKKNGIWKNQGGKGKYPGYISKIVAQLNVYDSKVSTSSEEDSQSKFHVRQFVLFSLDLRQADNKPSDFQPNDEVAAIVMSIPEKVEHSGKGESPATSNCFAHVGQKMPNPKSPGRRDPIKATVILPSGIHSLPSKGIPSSLIDRWESGGSCDCGGWDLGCKLTILSNQDPVNKNVTLSEPGSIASIFELFSQGGQQQDSVFRFAPFKDGAFSLEFSSSLSLVQAFSICIAILDSKKLFEVPESAAKALVNNESVPNNGAQTEVGIPARYVSYPPLSPVGRV